MEETEPSFWKATTGYASGKKCFSNGQKESSPLEKVKGLPTNTNKNEEVFHGERHK